MQLALPIPHQEALGRDDLMVTEANADAVALLDGWQSWPDARLALVGAEGAGKTHLAHIWAAETGARVIAARDLAAPDAPAIAEAPVAVEDADRGVDETALFHLWNACARSGAPLLLTGRRAPAEWDVALPDLRSRLASLTPARIGDPDDAMLSMLLVKLFADRQVAVRPGLIGWLLRRMERSHRAAREVVERLDAAALAEGRAVDERLARAVLDNPGAGA
ncbi:chromosomal replication initiator DnaA [Jannaschia sp. W003]|uniref:chromosomal replication initiator DnaA n=1 Tax=Jannaschia sp. W003 TaxID=2867012 RepID=UPI0021A58A31|nr:chromosomal replication initiator DnaA [Jannaschia sp. W003]UWQ23044.1 chromosomal replication initiator DnaA [Jannaschia sp. W003]